MVLISIRGLHGKSSNKNQRLLMKQFVGWHKKLGRHMKEMYAKFIMHSKILTCEIEKTISTVCCVI